MDLRLNKNRSIGNSVITGLLLGFYIAFLCVAFAFVNITENISPVFYVLILAGSLIFAFCVLKFLRKTGLTLKEQKPRKKKLLVFFLTALVSFLVMYIVYLGFAPGATSNDVHVQFGQVISGEYTDWHPFWHTIVFFALPYKLTGNYASITLFQLILFALVFGYMNLMIYDLRDLKTALVMDVLILPNPYVLIYLMYPWKDFGFAFAAITALLMSIRVYYQKENAKNWFLCILGVVAANSALFRHNGILFAVPLLLAAMTFIPRKKWIPLLLAFALFFVLVKIPVASLLQVEKPGDRIPETMGLPLTIIANVAKETPQVLDEETAEFVYSLAPQEDWENIYETGDYNLIKWNLDQDKIEEKGTAGILRMMFHCIANSRKAALKGLIAVTDLVYGVESGVDGVVWGEVQPNELGIDYTGNEEIQQHIRNYANAIYQSIFHYVFTYGAGLLVLLALILSRLKFKSWKSWKKVFLVFPLLIYDFGTMLFLSGMDYRFFWVTFLAVPVLCIFLLIKDDEKGIVR